MVNRYVECILKLLQKKEISRQTAHTLIKEFEKDNKSASSSLSTESKIAVIGMSCRMPQAPDIETFWKNLVEEVDCIQDFPKQRREDTDPYLKQIHPDLFINSNPYWPAGFLERIDLFDCQFFTILPGEAKYIDPQQRLFLEVAYEAMEDSGYTGERIRQTRTGVYIGHCDNEYKAAIQDISPAAIPGNLVPFIASRVAYSFDLRGPAISIATTCSSSLVALHTACQALRTGDCEMALVGATNLYLFPVNVKNDSVYMVGISAQDNRCRTFDSKANGVVRGEGSIALLLKPFEKALADKDQIHAVILGSAVNNDGHSSSLTAPNPLAQADMLKAAWENAGVDPRTISYIEAHGTGTKLGDPIEIQALSKAFSAYTEQKQFCGIGSLKTNIGHLVGGASGLAGVLKTILSLKNKKIPATLHFKEPNPLINFKDSAVYVVDKLQEWNSPVLRAGVSAFGFNGTNVHIVLERAEKPPSDSARGPFIFPASANSRSALIELVRRYSTYLKEISDAYQLGCFCYTAAVGRTHRAYRACFVFNDIKDLLAQLQYFIASPATDELRHIYVSSTLGKDELINLFEDPKPNQIAQAYCEGKRIPWKAYYKEFSYQTIGLPHYPFERQRFWIDGGGEENVSAFYGAATLSKGSTTNEDIEKQALSTDSTLNEEALFLSICKEVLGIAAVTLTDDFFELGGDSLLGIQLINGIHKAFSKKISLDTIFSSRSLQDILATALNSENSIYNMIPNQPLAETYPVSSAQRRLWLLDQMQDERNAYNMYDSYLFAGNLDETVFKKALEFLLLRHEGLRVTFLVEEGLPLQKVSSSLPLDYRFSEVSSEEEGYKMIGEIVKEPFDLVKGPLFKALLIRLPFSPSRFLFGFVVHHVICDGWSLHLMIRELLHVYNSYLHNSPVCLPMLRLQYKDYAAWQNDSSHNSVLLKQEKYWLEKLQGNLPICEIKGDLDRPAVFTFEGSRAVFQIEAPLASQLKELAKQHQASLYMVLLASIYTLIYRYSGERDLLIGSPVAGRSHYDLRHIVGCFINTLVMRTEIDPEESFSDLLQKVKQTVFEAFEHQDYPFDLLVNKLHLTRDTSRAPLFNINVVLQNVDKHINEASLKDVQIKPIEMTHHTTKWDLEFEFSERTDGSLHCFLEYYKKVYSSEMIHMLIETYLVLLKSLVQLPALPLFQVSCHLDTHLQKMTQTLNPMLKTSKGETLHSLFMKQVARTPQGIALRSGTQELTYQELDQTSTRIAQFLIQKGIGAGKLVGILMENSIETIASILGVLKAGTAYVPLEVQHPYHRLKSIIEEAQISFIISLKKHIRLLDDLQWTCPLLSSYLCLDSQILWQDGLLSSELMDERLWDYVAGQAQDDIQASGWVSSYTGLPFSSKEMEEYRNNTFFKLRNFLSKEKRILEVGCGSGLTMEVLAPHVGFYMATDLSQGIVQRTQKKAEELGLDHVSVVQTPAHELAQIIDSDFDIVVINSVVHCFPSLAYLKKVISDAKQKLNANGGIIFIGDLMDLCSREMLIESLKNFKQTNADSGYKTKTEFETELFVPRDFFQNLSAEIEDIQTVHDSLKQYTIENELTRFRYDIILEVTSQICTKKNKETQRKYQFDQRAFTSALDVIPWPRSSENSLAYVLFTSGSTGKPKGVLVSHQSLINYVTWANEYYLKEEKVVCFPFYTSLAFDLTLTSIFCPLFIGGTVAIYSGNFQDILKEIALDPRNNIIKITPAHLVYIADSELDLSHLKKYIIGGDALYGSIATLLSKQGNPEIYNEYGPTEATVGCVVYKTEALSIGKVARVPIGKSITGTRIYILDPYKNRVPIGAVGEIFIAGECLAKGYLNNELLTNERFVSNCFDPAFSDKIYQTGDLGRFLPSGDMEYVGRKDRQIKLRSHRIELEEIETRLKQHPHILEGAVILYVDEKSAEALVGYFSASQDISIEDLKMFLGETLPEYMVPQHLIALSSFPLTVNGKINIKALPKPGENPSKKYIPPTSELEIELIKLLEKLLAIHPISIEDDFFDLGGDSITAMRLLTHAKKCGINFSVKDIFQYRTIQALAKKCKKESKAVSIPPQEQKDSSIKGIAFSPIQHWFCEQNFVNPHYFNMGYLFMLPKNTDVALLEEAMRKCIKSHDMLRAKFDFSFSPPRQEIQCEVNFYLHQVQLQDLPYEEQKLRLKEHAEQLQSSLDISRDLLVLGTVFDLGKQGFRLLIVIHHLLVDGFSWRILAEDLQQCYYDPHYSLDKTDSFEKWTDSLSQFSKKRDLELDYWLQIAQDPPNAFREHIPQNLTQLNYIHETLIFSAAETQKLNRNCVCFMKTNLHDLLLAAFSHSLFQVLEISELWVNLESTGRDPSVTELLNCDVSRTVGWFTALYPVLLKNQSSFTDAVEWIRDTLEALPMKGLSYSLAKQAQHPQLQKLATPHILFNYFGRVEKDLLSSQSEALLRPCSENFGKVWDPRNALPYLLEVNAIILDDKLHIEMEYHQECFSAIDMEAWKLNFKHCLGQFIAENLFEHTS